MLCRSGYSERKDEVFKGVRLEYLPYIPTKHLETLSHSLLSSLYAVFKDYQIIHYHGLGSSIFSVLPRIFSKKSVVTVQGLDWKARKWGIPARLFLKLCEWTSARFPDRTVVVSRTLLEYYSKKHKVKVRYIANGANTADNLQSAGARESEDRRHILYLGRLAPQKGVHYLIEAFRNIDTDRRLIITGRTSYTDKYIRRLKNMAGEDKRIIFTGPLYGLQKEEILSNAYLFVLPSEIEGLSISLLESMGHKRCCLVSDIAENMEAIGSSGFSFRTKDTKDLKERLEYLLSNPDLVEDAGGRARTRIREHYNWKKITDEMEKLYLNIIG